MNQLKLYSTVKVEKELKQWKFLIARNKIIKIRNGIKKELIFIMPSILFKKVKNANIAINVAPKMYGMLNSCEKYAEKPATIIIKDISKNILIILQKTVLIKPDLPTILSINWWYVETFSAMIMRNDL